jgi:hypothetical protein
MAAQLIGVDFSSAPTRRKPITVAIAQAGPGTVVLREILRFESLPNWHDWLAAPGEWVGAFDFPFGLPRAFVAGLGWPLALVLAGLLVMAVGYYAVRINKKYLMSVRLK